MSWNVSGIGTSVALKAHLETQFETCKENTINIPSEHATVALLKEVTEAQLNFLAEHAPGSAVRVTAGGSQYLKTSSYEGGTSVQFTLEVLGPFIG